MTDTVVWISGATQGIGAALARTVPHSGAKVINLSRRPHPELQSLSLDLHDRASVRRACDHLGDELRRFQGRRAIFIQNAVTTDEIGLMKQVDPAVYEESLLANAVAPISLGAAFLRAAPRDVEAGLVMMSAGGAIRPFPGHSAYCAAKAALEQWVRVMRLELASEPNPPWIVAVRPGFVDTPMSHNVANLDTTRYPARDAMRKSLADALVPEFVARQIWAELPPAKDVAVIACSRQGAKRFNDEGTELVRV